MEKSYTELYRDIVFKYRGCKFVLCFRPGPKSAAKEPFLTGYAVGLDTAAEYARENLNWWWHGAENSLPFEDYRGGEVTFVTQEGSDIFDQYCQEELDQLALPIPEDKSMTICNNKQQ